MKTVKVIKWICVTSSIILLCFLSQKVYAIGGDGEIMTQLEVDIYMACLNARVNEIEKDVSLTQSKIARSKLEALYNEIQEMERRYMYIVNYTSEE